MVRTPWRTAAESVIVLLLTAASSTFPGSLFAQGLAVPGGSVLLRNGILGEKSLRPISVLNQFDLLLLTSPSPDNDQSVLLVDLANPSRNTLVKLPELSRLVNSSGEKKIRYEHVAADLERDVLYFSWGGGIGSMRVGGDGGGTVLYEPVGAPSISNLRFYAGKLYWIEDQKHIKSVGVNGTESPHTILSSDSDKIQGIAVDISAGVLYYSTWPNYSRTNASIKSVNLREGGGQSTIVLGGLLLPKQLDVVEDTLVWVSNPPGIYFTVEGMKLGNGSRNVLVKQARQHAGSLVVKCGRVYWSDLVGKRVWGAGVNFSYGVVGGEEVGGSGGVVEVVRGGGECVEVKEEEVQVQGEEKEEQEQKQIRVCTNGEARLTGCWGGEVVCVVFGEGGMPVCLMPNQPPSKLEATPDSTVSSSLPRTGSQVGKLSGWPREAIITIGLLGFFVVLMSCFSLCLGLRVRKLSRKPIIRRRVVVSRRASESASERQQMNQQQPTSVCEMIDIENCCNMNVCETPCYERTLIPSTPTAPQQGTTTTTTTTVISVNSSNGWESEGGGACGKKEDKRCLLSI